MYTPGPAVAPAIGVTAMFDKSDGMSGLVECVGKLLGANPDAAGPEPEAPTAPHSSAIRPK